MVGFITYPDKNNVSCLSGILSTVIGVYINYEKPPDDGGALFVMHRFVLESMAALESAGTAAHRY